MTHSKKIQSFYLTYKKCHVMIELELKDVLNNQYIASRVLDKVIVYLFIKEYIGSMEGVKVDLREYDGESLWLKLLNFFKIPSGNKYLQDLLRLTVKTINNDIFDKEIVIHDEIMEKILKEFSRFTWVLDIDNCDRENCISPDILGYVFEKYLNQKESGAYYTENDVIKYINENSLIMTIFNKVKDKSKLIRLINLQNIPRKINNLEDLMAYNINPFELLLRIIETDELNHLTIEIRMILSGIKLIDLTCGTGAFLIDSVNMLYKIELAICKKLMEDKSDTKIMLSIIKNNIFGLDIMDDAIQMVKFRLLLLILKYSVNNKDDLPNEIEFNLFAKNVLVPNLDLKKELVSENAIKENHMNVNSDIYKFIDVIKSGGFDCVIGNPPYIEYARIKNQYHLDEFITYKCKNIYAYATERCIDILREGGILGLIVPISLVSTPRMYPLRKLINDKFGTIFYSSFADRPGTLFNGVHQKTSIIIARKDAYNKPLIYTTKYYHWYKEERDVLFDNLQYIKNDIIDEHCCYKLGSEIEKDIFDKMNLKQVSIESMFADKGEYKAYLNDRMCFWVKCFSGFKDSNSFKEFKFNTEEEKWVFVALANSNLFYYLWCVVSDGWHITKKDMKYFKFNYSELSETQKNTLVELAKELECDLENNKKYIGSKQVSHEYKHKKSKIIMDKIDLVLKDYYMLSEQEYNFIIYYNLKYRMNDEMDLYLKNKNETNKSIIS